MNVKELLGNATVKAGISHKVLFIRAWHKAVGVPLQMPRDALNDFSHDGSVPAYVIEYCEWILRQSDDQTDFDALWFGN